jgi:RNA polymerase sigma-70 factor, ECF subfamily
MLLAVLPFHSGGSRIAEARSPVVPLGSEMDDADLVCAVRERARWAPAALYDRYAASVERLIVRLLGVGADVDDVFQEVFAAAFHGIDDLREPARLKSWLLRITVLTVREHLRARRRRRWLIFQPPDTLPEGATAPLDDVQEAAAHAYRLLDRMSPTERIPFLLHMLTNMELAEIAEACGISLATVKRRIARADRWFQEQAQKDSVLKPWTREHAKAQ